MTGAAVAISAGLATAGYAANRMATNQQLRAQDRDAAAGIMKQGELQRQANNNVQKGVIDTAKNNSASIARNQQSENAQYAAALARAKPTQDAAFNAQPGASARYTAGVNNAVASNNAFGSDLAKTTSITDAPALTQQQTEQQLGDTAGKLGILSDTSANQNTLTQNKIKGEQANPWLQALGATLNGAAAGYGGVAGGKKNLPTGSAAESFGIMPNSQ
jgi:hypothetical protein